MNKNVLIGVGGALILGVVIYGKMGFYQKDLPWMLGALFVGGILAYVGSKMK